MLKNHNGQVLVRIGKDSCVFTFMELARPQILDALNTLSELFRENRMTPFFRTGAATGEQIVVTKLDPGPGLDDLDIGKEA